MDVSNLVRNAARIRSAYSRQEDGSVIVNRPMEVHIPKRYTENGMAVVGEKVWTSAVVGLVIPGECYAPLIAVVDITMVPLAVREVGINGVQYYVLEFEKGDTLIEDLSVLQDPNKSYQYGLEFGLYAKIPWFMTKDDLTSIFDYAKYESGRQIGSSPQVPRILNSYQLRDPDNLDNAYRNSQAMLDGREPVIVGLNNGSMLIKGVFPKLQGGHLRENVLGAIVNPDNKVTDLEQIIKGVPI